MTPLHFGVAQRRLFGVFHAPQGAATSGAVLLCSPFAHEAIQAHRFYRMLAQRLCAGGCHVLRFDYFGSGDSAGSDREANPSGWVEDILTAHDELLLRSGSSACIWMGARLGATLAWAATHRLPSALQRLVLWEPILDGMTYMADLAALHARSIDIAYAGAEPAWQRLPRTQNECVGFELGPRMREELVALDADALAAPRALRCDVVAGDIGALTALQQRWQGAGLEVRMHRLENGFDWTAEAADEALVPAESLECLANAIAQRT